MATWWRTNLPPSMRHYHRISEMGLTVRSLTYIFDICHRCEAETKIYIYAVLQIMSLSSKFNLWQPLSTKERTFIHIWNMILDTTHHSLVSYNHRARIPTDNVSIFTIRMNIVVSSWWLEFGVHSTKMKKYLFYCNLFHSVTSIDFIIVFGRR